MIPVSPALVAALARGLAAVDRALVAARAQGEPEAPAVKRTDTHGTSHTDRSSEQTDTSAPDGSEAPADRPMIPEDTRPARAR